MKKPIYMILLSRVRLTIRVFFGKVFSLAGIPGLVRECTYSAGVTNAEISVKVKDLFTVVSVNGMDIYFHRLTGAIDGVGVNRCNSGNTPKPESVRDSPECLHRNAQIQSE
jgi:hypothetical protein